jgi:hypothetical protein
MGMYVYKVTGKVVLDSEGRKANLLKYAYKPWSTFGLDGEEGERRNNRLHRETGCYNAERYAKTGKRFTGRVVFESGEESRPNSSGIVYA